MKFYFRLFVAWLLLCAWWNFASAQNLSVDQFNSIWNNGLTDVCYSGTSVVSCSCTEGNAVRGCVRNAKQSVWVFENPWDVGVRKLVWPSDVLWLFNVHIWVGWKRIPQPVNSLDVCSVVVFDKSGSMKNWYNGGSPTKRSDAVSWAIGFSNSLIDWTDNKIWLVFFAASASVWRWLQNAVFDESLFTGFTPSWNTNIYDWLLKAENMLDWAEDCDSKYIVLMSDWDANLPTSASVWPWKAKEIATKLKNKWIIIYSIWYDVKASSTAIKTLKAIAQDNDHYTGATTENIIDVFLNIWNFVELNAWTPYTIDDGIWSAFDLSWSDINVPTENQLVDPGTVYSFQIRIKPWMTWFQDSNSWLTLTYDDVDNVSQSLNIDQTAQIYWEFPKCGWNYPWWNSVIIWSDEFEQTWSWNALVPESKDWTYVPNSIPGECEWDCIDNNYWWNTITNTCELWVKVDFDVNGWTGNIPSQLVVSWMNAEEPTVQPIRTWYQFTWWTLHNEEFILPWTVTWNITLKAAWKPNVYEVRFNWNGSTDGVMWNQEFTYDVTWTLNDNEFVKEWYHFTWWNTSPVGNWTAYTNEQVVKNLLTTWQFDLYAQREPNPYTIIFDWNGATAWTMSPLGAVYDTDIKLTKNSYSKNWSKFLWWNTSPDGNWTAYTNEQVVKNLATEWEVILYAQWEKVWSSWWGWGCKKDDCPDGDFSWDRCDWKCWKDPEPKPEPEPNPEPTPIPEPTPVVPDKKCSIEGSTHSAEVNEAYIWACQEWIIKSDTIQWARLWEFLNRAEMAKITTVFEMLELWSQPDRSKDCSAFADSMAWYNQEMKNYMVTSCQLLRMWIHTADYTPIPDFMPRKFVSRAEFGTILSRILWWDKYEAEKNSRYYYVEHLNKLKAAWILTDINPNLVERRSYAILMIYRAAKMMWKI